MTTTEFDMTADETAEAQAMLAQLRANGYRDIGNHGPLSPGARIRHRAEQYPEAYRDGTGVVLHLTEKPESSWSQSYGAPDIELTMLRDKAQFGSRLSQLAHYHVETVEETS